MKIKLLLLFSASLLVCCNVELKKPAEESKPDFVSTGISLHILGTVQDAGSPHIACKKACCSDLFNKSNPERKVVSIGIIDHENQQSFLFDASPDIAKQVKLLKKKASWEADELPNGIFLTHAHIGHYTGLMYLGKEATNAQGIQTYVMPQMKEFLEQNGPWSQLVSQNNIRLQAMVNRQELRLTSGLIVIPMKVPHRDEFSETVGYKIIGPNKSVLFIPDIDKWEKWEVNIVDELKTVDYAFLDASFYDGNELNTRDISQIPHPFVIESMSLFESLPKSEKAKIHFIHFNHTNALLNLESEQANTVLHNGFNIAQFNQVFKL